MRWRLIWLALLLAGPAAGQDLALGPLAGTLLRPAGVELPPVALILPGSGPTDRNGDQPGLGGGMLRRLAEGLAEQGIASFRADKRGVAASAAGAVSESDLRIETYVADALGWRDLLDARQDLGPVILLGHSEGALIATLAAEAGGIGGLVLLAGAGEPIGRVITAQLAAAEVPADLQAAAQDIMTALRDGQAVPDVPDPLVPLFRPSVQPYMASWLRHDPAAVLAGLPAGLPVLLVAGSTDLQVPPGQAELLAAARPAAQLLVVEGMNHILRHAPAERAANLATYVDPSLPLASELLPALAGFINGLPRN